MSGSLIRPVALLVAGLTLGLVAGVYVATLSLEEDARPAPSVAAGTEVADGADVGVPVTAAPAASLDRHDDRLDLYRRAAAADGEELLALMQATIAEPPAPARRFRLEVLLRRFAEVDPAAAIAAAHRLGLGASSIAVAYETWGQADSRAALAALGQENDSMVARTAARALARALGDDSAALLDVIEALPPGVDAVGLQVDILMERSRYDPLRAITDAMSFPRQQDRTRALTGIAGDIATRDPASAIAAAAQIIDDGDRENFERTVMRTWSANDPEGVFLFLDGVAADRQEAIAGAAIGALASADPERLLTLTENWSGRYAENARYRAIGAWAVEDPQRAIAWVGEMPPGQKRDRMLTTIARGYGSKDVDSALAWAASLQPRPRGIVQSIIDGVANNDPDRAFDIALTLDNENDQLEAMQSVMMRMSWGSSATNPERIANRALALEDRQLRERSLQMLAYTWARREPTEVMEWLQQNRDSVPRSSVLGIVHQIAESDPQLAASYIDRVPADSRADWLQMVANGYAKSDAEGALAWLAQYQGQPGYDGAVTSVAEASARNDPIRAARNIERFPNADNAAVIARTAGREWAQRDPRSAVQWAAGISNSEVRGAAIVSVVNVWAHKEPDAAANWAMSMADGAQRDSALSAAISGVAATQVPDDRLFDALSTDMARQQAVVSASIRLARSNRAAAERLIDKYVTDPTLLRQARQNIVSYSRY